MKNKQEPELKNGLYEDIFCGEDENIGKVKK